MKKELRNDYRKKRYKNHILILTVLFILACISILFCSNRAFQYTTEKFDVSEAYKMQSGETVSQSLPPFSGELNGITVFFGTFQRVNTGTMIVNVYEDGIPIRSCNLDSGYLTDNTYHTFYFSRPIQASLSHQYNINITYNYEGDENAIALWTSYSGDAISSFNKDFSDHTLCFQLVLVNSDFRNWAVGIYLVVLLCLFIHFIRTGNIENINIKKAVIVVAVFIVSIQVITTDLFSRLLIDVPVNPYRNLNSCVTIEPNCSFEASFEANYAKFNRFNFFVNEGDLTNINVEFINTDSETIYMNRRIEPYEIIQESSTGKTAVSLYAERVGSGEFRKGKYTVKISNTSSETPLVIEAVEDETNGNRISTVLTKRSWMSFRIACILILIITIYLYAIFWYSHKKKLSAAKFFIITIIPFGIVYCILMQPWSAPDTGAHFQAIYRLSNLLLGHTENNGWMIRADDYDYYWHVWGNATSNPSMQSIFGVLYNTGISNKFIIQNANLIEFPNPLVKMEYYSLISYFPEVIGFVIARIFRLGPVLMLCTGRLFMLIAYTFVCYRAIKITPVGKSIFTGVSLLPMSIMMSSAISYDGLAIVTALIFIASVFALYQKPRSVICLVESSIWAFLLGGIKGGGYLVLLPIVLMFISKNWKKSIKIMVPVFVMGFISVIIFDVILPDSQLFQFGAEGNGKLNALWGLLHPVEYFNMCARTFLDYMDILIINMGGNMLGWWLESSISTVIIVGFIIITGVASIFEKDEIHLEKKDRNVFCLTIFIVFYFTPIMLLSWTDVNSVRIEGLQGRYFLPVLPLIFMVFTKFKMNRATDVTEKELSLSIITRSQRLLALLSSVSVYYLMRLYLTR